MNKYGIEVSPLNELNDFNGSDTVFKKTTDESTDAQGTRVILHKDSFEMGVFSAKASRSRDFEELLREQTVTNIEEVVTQIREAAAKRTSGNK